MTIENRRSLRKCINDNCKNCIFDSAAAGTWRQQVTLCSVSSCSLFPVRPVTKVDIPGSVLRYYDRHSLESANNRESRPQEGLFSNPTIEKSIGGTPDHCIAAKQTENRPV